MDDEIPYGSKRSTRTPDGFSDVKGEPNYFLDAIRDYWYECGMSTDTEDLRWILNWFDDYRRELAASKPAT